MQAISNSWVHGIRRALSLERTSWHIAQRGGGDKGREPSLAMLDDIGNSRM